MRPTFACRIAAVSPQKTSTVASFEASVSAAHAQRLLTVVDCGVSTVKGSASLTCKACMPELRPDTYMYKCISLRNTST
jgi:hypothetical protein